MPEQLGCNANQQGEQVMATATAERIRPGRAAHRAWYATLDADAKAAARETVQGLIANGTPQASAWDTVYGSAQLAASDVGQQIDAAAAATVDKAEPEQAVIVDVPKRTAFESKGSRIIDTKTGKLPEHLTHALGSLSSIVDPATGKLYVMRGEQQRVVDALRRYVDGEDIKDHVAWSIESVIGKVRSVFQRVTDKGDNVNVRAIDAMVERDVQFEVVMRSDGSPTYKVGDDTMSARDALKRYSDVTS